MHAVGEAHGKNLAQGVTLGQATSYVKEVEYERLT